MTTVTPAGSPLVPVWFLWDGAESVPCTARRGHAFATSRRTARDAELRRGRRRRRHRCALGSAAIDHEAAPADQASDYRAKYDEHIARIGMTPETFARRYSVPVRVRLTRLRSH